MLSIPHVSIMMWIFYIDWQQYWKCDWTMNIGANRNAHGKQTVSTKQPQVTDLTVGLPDIWGTELVFKSLDRFTVQPIFSTRLITRMKRVFFFLRGAGCSTPMHLLFGAVYRSQGCRGYLDVSNVALVETIFLLYFYLFFIPATRCWNSLPALMNWAPYNGS